jgi:RNase P subunit RPR2
LLIKQGIEKTERFKILHETAKDQIKSLNNIDFIKSVKLISNKTVIELEAKENKNKIG